MKCWLVGWVGAGGSARGIFVQKKITLAITHGQENVVTIPWSILKSTHHIRCQGFQQFPLLSLDDSFPELLLFYSSVIHYRLRKASAESHAYMPLAGTPRYAQHFNIHDPNGYMAAYF